MKISDFVEFELEYFRKECNFTEEELQYFNLRAKDRTNVQIALEIITRDEFEKRLAEFAKPVIVEEVKKNG